MAKLSCCRFCCIELEPIKLADGTAVLVCVDCELIGLAHEVAQGGPMWRSPPLPRAPRQPSRVPRPKRRLAA